MADRIKPVTPVRTTTHPGETRSNIPTAALEWFARSEEKRPTVVGVLRLRHRRAQATATGRSMGT